MKLNETTSRNIVMIASFIYAGISLFFLIIFLMTYFLDGNFFLFGRFLTPHSGAASSSNLIVKTIAGFMAIFSALGMLLSLAAGILLLRTHQQRITEHVKEEVKEKFENKVDSDILLPDEKKIIEILEKNEGSMTQNDLVRESGLSKVKVHRVLKNLETKKIVTKYAFGMTNRIRLEKKIKEEENTS